MYLGSNCKVTYYIYLMLSATKHVKISLDLLTFLITDLCTYILTYMHLFDIYVWVFVVNIWQHNHITHKCTQ